MCLFDSLCCYKCCKFFFSFSFAALALLYVRLVDDDDDGVSGNVTYISVSLTKRKIHLLSLYDSLCILLLQKTPSRQVSTPLPLSSSRTLWTSFKWSTNSLSSQLCNLEKKESGTLRTTHRSVTLASTTRLSFVYNSRMVKNAQHLEKKPVVLLLFLNYVWHSGNAWRRWRRQ